MFAAQMGHFISGAPYMEWGAKLGVFLQMLDGNTIHEKFCCGYYSLFAYKSLLSQEYKHVFMIKWNTPMYQ